MNKFKFDELALAPAKLISPFLHSDERGDFCKVFEKEIYINEKIEFNTSEIFYSTSKKGVLRGLHLQTQHPQAKLVTVLSGEIYDVIVDTRKASNTYLEYVAVELSAENKKVLYVPEGFAHGFLTLSESATVAYVCSGEYYKEYDGGYVWDDEAFNIDWKLEKIGGKDNLIISQKDLNLTRINK